MNKIDRKKVGIDVAGYCDTFKLYETITRTETPEELEQKRKDSETQKTINYVTAKKLLEEIASLEDNYVATLLSSVDNLDFDQDYDKSIQQVEQALKDNIDLLNEILDKYHELRSVSSVEARYKSIKNIIEKLIAGNVVFTLFPPAETFTLNNNLKLKMNAKMRKQFVEKFKNTVLFSNEKFKSYYIKYFPELITQIENPEDIIFALNINSKSVQKLTTSQLQSFDGDLLKLIINNCFKTFEYFDEKIFNIVRLCKFQSYLGKKLFLMYRREETREDALRAICNAKNHMTKEELFERLRPLKDKELMESIYDSEPIELGQ